MFITKPVADPAICVGGGELAPHALLMRIWRSLGRKI